MPQIQHFLLLQPAAIGIRLSKPITAKLTGKKKRSDEEGEV
jgi:hypothetical protein